MNVSLENLSTNVILEMKSLQMITLMIAPVISPILLQKS